MNTLIQWMVFALCSMIITVTAGCSGGGGAASGAGAQAAAAKSVTGVAATGAPLTGAIVFIKDSSDIPVERHDTVRSDGSFTFDASGLKPPFFLKVNAPAQNYYSVADTYGLTNITPLSTIVVAQAAQRDDLDALYINLKPAEAVAVANNMAAADKTVQNTFAPLMNAFNVSGSLVYGTFTANGKGLDGMLDAINVTVIPGRITVTEKTSANGAPGRLLLQAAASQLAAVTIPTSGAFIPPATSPQTADGTATYTAKCAGCHGAIGNSNLKGRMSVALTQNAITSNRGGMSILNGMTTGELQSVADAILNSSTTPAPAPVADGTALYAANCAGCHGALASSTKKGMTIVRLQNAISGNVGGMGFLSSLSSTEQQALVETLNPPAPAPTPTPVPATPDGAALYAANCAGCHGTLANSTKQGITIARLQNAVNSNIGNMGYLSTLSVSEVQAIVTVLTPSTPTPTPAPTPSPVLDGQALYAANCASCHGALASSAKAGATATRIQTAITNNVGNMGYLSTLSTAQVAAVATSLAAVAPSPAPAPACGSCHAIPPASGKHAKHKSKGISCASCHGSGYTETSFNATTHNNGVKNIDAASTKWNASTRSCANSCHGNKTW